MTHPSSLRGPRATSTRHRAGFLAVRAFAPAGLLAAALAILALGAGPGRAAQPGATPGAPGRTTPLPPPLTRPVPGATASPAAVPGAVPGRAATAGASPAAKAGDADSTATLDLAEMDKSLSDETVTMDTANLRRLLGENPHFVYDPHGRPDPMLLPWEHLRARATALLAEGDRALKFGNLDLAERLYGMVRSTVGQAEAQTLPGQEGFDELRAQADAGSQKVVTERQRVAMGAAVPGGPPAKVIVPLPVWVRTHTSGVIFSKDEPLCLVGPYTLRVGDKVPGQTVDVEVVKIEKRAVTYRVAGETFVVGLEEGE